MKLLFLSDNFLPEVNAPANRTYEHCKEWVKQGVEVTVITGVPNFPRGKVYPGYKNKLYQTEEIDGIKVIRVWTYMAANQGFMKRIVDYLSFAVSGFLAGLFVKTDVIVATSPQFFTAMCGRALSFFKRTKWIMEVRDIWPESIKAVGAMGDSPVFRMFEWVELHLYRTAAHIIVVTDTFKRKIINKGIDGRKISVHKNGANLSLFRQAPKPETLVQKYGLEDKFVIGYIGTHGLAHGLQFVLESINELKDSHPHIQFLFVGDGARKQHLLNKAQELKLTNAIFLDSVPKAEVVDYVNLNDVALVNLKKSNTFTAVIPSKIFESAAMGKPILLGLEGESKGIIKKYNAGDCYVPEDRASFINAVLKMASDEEKYREYQSGCDELIKDFDRKQIAGLMMESIKGVLEPSYVPAPTKVKTLPSMSYLSSTRKETVKNDR